MASRGEELAQKEIEKLQSMEWDELVEAVEKSDNPFFELELLNRIEEKNDKIEEIQEEIEEAFEAIGVEE